MKTKQKRSTILQTELKKTDDRIAELKPQLDVHTEQLEKVNAAYLNDPGTIDDVVKATTGRSAIAEALATLTDHRAKLAADLDAALSVEAHAETVGALQGITVKRRLTLDKLIEDRKAVNDACERLLQNKAEFDSCEADFLGHINKIAPGFSADDLKFQNLPKKKPEIAAAFVALANAGITFDDLNLVLTPPTLPALPHETAIQEAQNYKARMGHLAAINAREDRKDRMRAKAAEDRQKELAKHEAEMKILAVKQQRGWKLQNALR